MASNGVGTDLPPPAGTDLDQSDGGGSPPEDGADRSGRGGRTPARTLLRRVVALLVVVAVAGLAAIAIWRPWAITIALEGFPDPTWPADGRFVERGELTAPVPATIDGGDAAEGLIDLFDESAGSAIVVGRDGRIVFSHVAPGFAPETAFNSYSMVKSLVGVLAIKAVSDGEIADLDAPTGELWPEAADSAIAEVTLRQLLDMRSGIVFEQGPIEVGTSDSTKDQAVTYSPFSNFARLHVQGPDALLDDLEVVASEQDRFVYQNLNTAIVARILEEVHGVDIATLLDEQLATPAGAGGFRWRRYSSADEASGYCCLYAPATWWLAVADHILTNGDGGEPLLTPRWHDYLLGRDLDAEDLVDGHYRSQIRYDIFDRDGEDLSGPFLFFAGRGGQMTYLVPDENLVIVRFGERNQRLHSTGYEAARLAGASP